MDEDLDLQRALHMSLGGEANQMPQPASSPGIETEEEALQHAMMLSMGTPSALDNSADNSAADQLSRAPAEARQLLRTIVFNLQKAAEPNCDPAQAAKYRQLNDGVLRRKMQQAAAPEASLQAATAALGSLGFHLLHEQQPEAAAAAEAAHATASIAARWSLPEGVAPAPALLDALLKAAAAADGQHSESGAAAGTSPGAGGSSRWSVPAPIQLRDFDCHQLGQLRGLPCALQLLAYPRNSVQLVEAADCVAWASTTGSERSHWGSFGRRGEDDRVVLTLFAGFGAGGGSGVAAHWYSPGGEERTMPSVAAQTGGWQWVETHINQTFVLRAVPQQAVALCGVKILARPYETDGHLLLMVLPAAAEERVVLQQAGRVLASLREDRRETAAQPQGGKPAPPPPGWRNRR